MPRFGLAPGCIAVSRARYRGARGSCLGVFFGDLVPDEVERFPAWFGVETQVLIGRILRGGPVGRRKIANTAKIVSL